MIFLRDPSGCQAEDAFVPVFAAEDEDAGLGMRDLPFGRLAYHLLHCLPLRVHPIEVGAELPRDVVVFRGEEIDGRLRGREPSCRIDARSNAEADVYRS